MWIPVKRLETINDLFTNYCDDLRADRYRVFYDSLSDTLIEFNVSALNICVMFSSTRCENTTCWENVLRRLEKYVNGLGVDLQTHRTVPGGYEFSVKPVVTHKPTIYVPTCVPRGILFSKGVGVSIDLYRDRCVKSETRDDLTFVYWYPRGSSP